MCQQRGFLLGMSQKCWPLPNLFLLVFPYHPAKGASPQKKTTTEDAWTAPIVVLARLLGVGHEARAEGRELLGCHGGLPQPAPPRQPQLQGAGQQQAGRVANGQGGHLARAFRSGRSGGGLSFWLGVVGGELGVRLGMEWGCGEFCW